MAVFVGDELLTTPFSSSADVVSRGTPEVLLSSDGLAFTNTGGSSFPEGFRTTARCPWVALLRPFGILGEAPVAGMWSLPFDNIFPGSGQRAQYGVETYWNIALTPNSTITPGIQLIFNPSFNPTRNFIAVPDVKFRVSI